MELHEELERVIEGGVHTDPDTRKKYSRDKSIFEILPSVVVFPKHAEDVARAVRTVRTLKQEGRDVSITPRAAGTDMSGGPLTPSVSLVFTEHMNRMFEVEKTENSEQRTANRGPRTPDVAGTASCEPGVFYRDFDKATNAKGLIMPAYPASRGICALGGMIADNCGGELTLRYGSIERYVASLDVVLSDGSKITTTPLSPAELEEKKQLQTLEGEIYRRVETIVSENEQLIESSRPRVSKNSSGYALWNVRRGNTFDLTPLIVGSQGTLGIITKATLRLVRPKRHRAMLVIFLDDLVDLPKIVARILHFDPEAFESFDDKTFRLAMRFFFDIIRSVGLRKMFQLAFAFLPEAFMALTGGIPQLVLIAEFAEDTKEAAEQKAKDAERSLTDLHLATHTAGEGLPSEKYWIVRRESFSLLRKNVQGLYAAPFIDDIVIPPDQYPVFLPKLYALLAEYKLLYTIAGHIGDGNLHIIPLVDLKRAETRKMILELVPRVYKLTVAHGGSITGEHNDGIIRTPFVSLQFGARMYSLFEAVKKTFDPLNILNPGKKVGGTEEDIKRLFLKAH